MFNYLFHPYLRWLRDRSESDRPDFNIDRDGSPPRNLVQPPVNFSIPESDVLPQPAPPTGLVNFLAEQPNEIPGFRVGRRGEAPGFNLNENDLTHPETTWPDWVETPPPESSDTAQTLPVPPGVEEPDPPTPQPPEWLRNVLAMPVPQLSTAFDPQTGRRIVPYEPLINWTRPYPSVDQNARGHDAAGAYAPEIEASPGRASPIAPAIKQWAPPVRPARPADIITRAEFPPPMAQEARWNSWPQPLKDSQTAMHTSGVDAGGPWNAVVQPPQQQTPFPQEQQTEPTNVPETTSGKDLAGIQPTPLIRPSPVERSVYRPDIDPGYDDLFEPAQGVQENKTQGDDAKRKEQTKIEKANPEKRMATEIRIYAEGLPSYMVGDIIHRPNGTITITITEVKSGDAKLSLNQAPKLAEAILTRKIYIINEPAAKRLEIKPRVTFADQKIIPQVVIVGGDQDAIKKQLRNLGVDTIPEKVRRGQPPRLRIILPPT